ncbi:unnamed protein product [Cercospora beticola]|nr:unnamed protein product [Cercospora beticola]
MSIPSMRSISHTTVATVSTTTRPGHRFSQNATLCAARKFVQNVDTTLIGSSSILESTSSICLSSSSSLVATISALTLRSR